MKKSYALLLLSAALLAGCNYDNLGPDTENGVWIRITNASSYDFKNVYVNTGSDDHQYGDIPAGQSSAYVEYESAYRYAFVQLQINGDTFNIQPIDYVGETLLENGAYTYEIDADNSNNQYGRLSLTLRED